MNQFFDSDRLRGFGRHYPARRMAAGAIPPKDAFQHVFENGADHILAGMFDFEIEEDAAIIREALLFAERERPWMS